MPPAGTLPSAHSRLVAGAADTKVSYRNQVPASANSRGSVQSGVIVSARVVRDYVRDSAARSGFTSENRKFQKSTAQSCDSLRAKIENSKNLLLSQVIHYERK